MIDHKEIDKALEAGVLYYSEYCNAMDGTRIEEDDEVQKWRWKEIPNPVLQLFCDIGFMMESGWYPKTHPNASCANYKCDGFDTTSGSKYDETPIRHVCDKCGTKWKSKDEYARPRFYYDIEIQKR